MRVLDTGLGGIVRLAFSSDGRFLLATAADHTLAVLDPATGDVVRRIDGSLADRPAAISPCGTWVITFAPELNAFPTAGGPPVTIPQPPTNEPRIAGESAFTPDGRFLTITYSALTANTRAGLARWSVPDWRPQPGFDFFPAFDRLAYSPDGDYLAGISLTGFEVRYARTGGLHASASPREFGRFVAGSRIRRPALGRTHLGFSPRGDYVLFGWDGVLNVVDVTGRLAKRALTAFPEVPRDAAFTGDGRRIGAVGDDGSVRFWEAGTWLPAGRYDWGAGPLRAVAFAPAGGPGACGTADGAIVLFDVDD